MMNQLTNEQKRIHERAKTAGRNHARAEWEAIEALRDVHRENVHRLVGKRNLYTYAVEEMGLSEGIAYAMAAIAKKTFEIAEILPAITAGRVSTNKMGRMLSVAPSACTRKPITSFQSVEVGRTTRPTSQRCAGSTTIWFTS